MFIIQIRKVRLREFWVCLRSQNGVSGETGIKIQFAVFCLRLHIAFVAVEYWLGMTKWLIKRKKSLVQGISQCGRIEGKGFWHSLLNFPNAESLALSNRQGASQYIHGRGSFPPVSSPSEVRFLKKEGRWDQGPKCCLSGLIHVNFPED